jgi:hypothetical protein
MEYLGNAVPRLPLAQCTRTHCDCIYDPVGTDKLHRFDWDTLITKSPK